MLPIFPRYTHRHNEIALLEVGQQQQVLFDAHKNEWKCQQSCLKEFAIEWNGEERVVSFISTLERRVNSSPIMGIETIYNGEKQLQENDPHFEL